MGLLDLVVTIKEAEERWHYSNATIRRWIEEERIKARQSGGTWLIEVPSVVIFLATRQTKKFRQSGATKTKLSVYA